MNEVIYGLGANLGDPLRQLAAAVRMLSETVEVRKVSGVYRTEPVGYREQPDFFNLVLLAGSPDAPEALLAEAIRIEQQLGRIRTFPNAPRAIDIDLLGWDGSLIETPALVLPHPRMHLRAFVLAPLTEIAPSWLHPRLGLTAAEMLGAIGSHERIERVGELPEVS